MRLTVYAAGLLLAVSGSIVAAQGGAKVSTPEELDKVMKTAGKAMQTAQKALGSNNYAEVRTQLSTVREAVLESQSFWILHKKDDAVKMNKDALAKLDELIPMVATDTVDAAKTAATLKEVGGACRSCHQEYRERDADNNFILKPGKIDG